MSGESKMKMANIQFWQFYSLFFEFTRFFSVCKKGRWISDNVQCSDLVKCAKNQVYSQKASACQKTCANKGHHEDCEEIKEGCTCPDGLVLNYDVSTHEHA